MDLRKPFFSQLLKMAKKDKDIILLVGDLGYSFMEEFQRELPDQFINAGIAEQNMVGAAAGLALGGKKPYCYSGLIFLVMRAYEQIRDDVCYNNLNVKLIGTGASQFLGFSHNLEGSERDYCLLRNLPHLEMFYPEEEKELNAAMIRSYKFGWPTYIKI